MPTAYEEATALAQQYVADRMGAMQARIDELEAARQGAVYGALPPAVPASGAHYSAPGAYEGYADYGFDPVMYQRSPYATATTRVFAGPNGQLGVQPLIGFPSAYPHVIQYPGDNPLRALPLLDAFVGSMWRNLPPPTIVPMRGGMGIGGGGAPSRTAPNKTAPNKTAAGVGTRRRGDPYEPDNAIYPPLPAAPAPTPAAAATASYDKPWYYYSANGEALPAKMGFNNWPQEAGQAVWDWLSGAGKPTPDELNAEYNAALQQQSPAVQRAAQDFIQQQPVPLTALAGALDVIQGAQKVPQRLELPPVSESLYDAVNTPRNAVLDAMRR